MGGLNDLFKPADKDSTANMQNNPTPNQNEANQQPVQNQQNVQGQPVPPVNQGQGQPVPPSNPAPNQPVEFFQPVQEQNQTPPNTGQQPQPAQPVQQGFFNIGNQNPSPNQNAQSAPPIRQEMFGKSITSPPPGQAAPAGLGNPPSGVSQPAQPPREFGAANDLTRFMQEHDLKDVIKKDLDKFQGVDNQITRVGLLLPKYWNLKQHYDPIGKRKVLCWGGTCCKKLPPATDYYVFMIAVYFSDPATGQVCSDTVQIRAFVTGFTTSKTFYNLAVDLSTGEAKLRPNDIFLATKNAKYNNHDMSQAQDSYLQHLATTNPDKLTALLEKAESLIPKIPELVGIMFTEESFAAYLQKNYAQGNQSQFGSANFGAAAGFGGNQQQNFGGNQQGFNQNQRGF